VTHLRERGRFTSDLCNYLLKYRISDIYITMTYKTTTTTLAIVAITALLATASIVIALSVITEGTGISHANAAVAKKVHLCKAGHTCKPERRLA
jgi:hypothetical protein